MSNHPMQPSDDQIRDWRLQSPNARDAGATREHWIARTAYAAGADAQLSADVEWVRHHHGGFSAQDLRAAMRPKPPSLAEQGTTALADLEGLLAFIQQSDPTTRHMVRGRTASELLPAIRQAIERLAELEGLSDG